jgi:hydrogenase maturation protease
MLMLVRADLKEDMPRFTESHSHMTLLAHREGNCQRKVSVLTIGSMLNGDDGAPRIASAMLPKDLKDVICRFDFDAFTYFLSECVAGHQTVIIVDTVSSDEAPGHTELIDLLAVLDGSAMKPKTAHGFSMLNELRIARRSAQLPQNLLLLTIEAGRKQWASKLSHELTEAMPDVAAELEKLVRSHLCTDPAYETAV